MTEKNLGTDTTIKILQLDWEEDYPSLPTVTIEAVNDGVRIRISATAALNDGQADAGWHAFIRVLVSPARYHAKVDGPVSEISESWRQDYNTGDWVLQSSSTTHQDMSGEH